MRTHQGNKIVAVYSPTGYANNTSPTMATVDTAGWDQCKFQFHLGSTDIALTALSIREADTVGGTVATVTGTDLSSATDMFGTATALPGATDDNKIYQIIVNTRGRKRYLQPVVTIGNGTAGASLGVTAELSCGETAPHNTTEHGAAACVIV